MSLILLSEEAEVLKILHLTQEIVFLLQYLLSPLHSESRN